MLFALITVFLVTLHTACSYPNGFWWAPPERKSKMKKPPFFPFFFLLTLFPSSFSDPFWSPKNLCTFVSILSSFIASVSRFPLSQSFLELGSLSAWHTRSQLLWSKVSFPLRFSSAWMVPATELFYNLPPPTPPPSPLLLLLNPVNQRTFPVVFVSLAKVVEMNRGLGTGEAGVLVENIYGKKDYHDRKWSVFKFFQDCFISFFRFILGSL